MNVHSAMHVWDKVGGFAGGMYEDLYMMKKDF